MYTVINDGGYIATIGDSHYPIFTNKKAAKGYIGGLIGIEGYEDYRVVAFDPEMSVKQFIERKWDENP
jgi:hypothetical protein